MHSIDVFIWSLIVAVAAAFAVAVLAIGWRNSLVARIGALAIMAGTAAFLIRASYAVGSYGFNAAILMGLGVMSGAAALLAYQLWYRRQS